MQISTLVVYLHLTEIVYVWLVPTRGECSEYRVFKVEIEKLDCILSKRATRSIYMRLQVRLNAICPYQSQQSSPAIRDITVSGHTRQHLWLYEAHLRRRPVYAISGFGQPPSDASASTEGTFTTHTNSFGQIQVDYQSSYYL